MTDPVVGQTAVGSGLVVDDVTLVINRQTILSSVCLALGTGRVSGLLGPNGAGKTSLLRMISAQHHDDEAYSGEVRWQDDVLAQMTVAERARRVAVVNQLNDGVFALSLRQIVAMGLLPHQSLMARETAADTARVEQALERVGLADKQQRRFSSLSGGEQQRGLIARALVQRAELVVLDEPVNHLDVYYQHDILALLAELAHEQGMTVVMSLHDLNLAATYCDQLALLHQGRLEASGSPEDVLQAQLLEAVFRLPCDVRQQYSSTATAADGKSTMRVDFHPHASTALAGAHPLQDKTR